MNEVTCDKAHDLKDRDRDHTEPIPSPQPPNLLYFGKKLFVDVERSFI